MSAMKRTLLIILLVGVGLANHNESKKETHSQDISHRFEEHLLSPRNDTWECSALNLSEMNSNFGFNLYKNIADKHNENIFLSPISISFNLASLMFGSRGDTYNQLLTGLNWEALNKQEQANLLPKLLKELRDKVRKSAGYDLELESLSFVHQLFHLHDKFINEMRMYFDTEYITLDFHEREAKNIISEFITKKTKGKVTEILDELDPQTKMMLFDFILFKGKWQTPFNREQTKSSNFYIHHYHPIKVPMMYKTEKVASMFDKVLSCTVLKLPYKGDAYMLIVMPEKGGDLNGLEPKLSMNLVMSWLEKMKTRKTDIFFPKFQLDQKYKLKSHLEELGIKDVFTGLANLTGMTEDRNMYLSEVMQRAAIDIDEIGTEATAVTGSKIVAFSLPHTIHVKNPFVFMIFNENCKSLLFIGRVTDPSKS